MTSGLGDTGDRRSGLTCTLYRQLIAGLRKEGCTVFNSSMCFWGLPLDGRAEVCRAIEAAVRGPEQGYGPAPTVDPAQLGPLLEDLRQALRQARAGGEG